MLRLKGGNGDQSSPVPPGGLNLGGSLPARLPASLGDGGTIYISPSGNDSTGDGSIGSPYFSPHKAFSVVALTGGLILARGGTYDLSTSGVGGTPQQQFNRVGSTSNPPQIKAYPGETPVFDKEMFLIGPSATTKGLRIGPGLVFNGGVNTTAWDGIRIEDAAGYVEIVGCTIRNAPKGNGLLIAYPSSLTQVQVWDCIIHSNGDPGAGTTYHGVYWGEADDTCLIANCVFYDNAGFAIQAGPTSNDLIMTCLTSHSDGSTSSRGSFTIWSQAPYNSNPGNRMYGCIATDPFDGGFDYCYSFSGLADTDAPEIHDSIWNGAATEGIEPQTGLITSNIVHDDPLYVNAASRDLRLGASSPAIDLVASGHYGYIPALDINGNTRITADAGAYAKEA